MDNLDKKQAGRMTHLEAWAHFYTRWQRVPLSQRKRVPLAVRSSHIRHAQSDYLGKRRNGKGEVLALGSKRVAQILQAVTEAMPDVFRYVYHPPMEEWFEVK